MKDGFCRELIRSDWGRCQCSRKATTPDGFCTQHSPAKKAERDAKRHAKFEEEIRRRNEIIAEAARLNRAVDDATEKPHAVTWYSAPYGPAGPVAERAFSIRRSRFPDTHDSSAAYARSICHRCPVEADCLSTYINEPVGVWGGTTPEMRRLLRSRARRAA